MPSPPSSPSPRRSATVPTFHSVFFDYLGRKPEVQASYEAIQARIANGPEAILDTRLDRYLGIVERPATRPSPVPRPRRPPLSLRP
jgi:hypothetical protein